MPTAKTYHVGIEGQVFRMDDLSGTWNSIPIVISSVPVTQPLYDVETDPTDGNKVVVVGRMRSQNGVFGIYVSTDAGLTWSQPGGNYTANAYVFGPGVTPSWFEVDYHDPNNIFVSGTNGYIAVSTDGGLTFNLSTQVPATPTCSICPPDINPLGCLHFISPTTGVVGLTGTIAKTTDAGVTWTILPLINAGATGDLYQAQGIHMSANGQVINVLGATGIFRSTDAGVTWTNTYSFTNRIGKHLTWINDNELWAFNGENLILKSTDAGATWTVVRAQTPTGPVHLAGHFYQGQNGFFSDANLLRATSDGATTDSPSNAPTLLITAVWTWLAQVTCYQLIPCDLSYPVLTVSNDLSSIVDSFIQVCPENLPSNVVNPPTGNPFSVPDGAIGQVFLLEACCQNTPSVLITGYNLTPFHNSLSVIQIDQLPGVCWRVKKASNGVPPITLTGTITGYQYANCASCTTDFACESVVPPTLPGCMCYQIKETTECTGAIELVGIDTALPFNNCDACAAQNNGPCYQLIDCSDPQHIIISNDDLEIYLDQVIEIKGCPDVCFTVIKAENCIGAISVLPVTASFETCELCNYVPVIPTGLITRRVKPGYDTPACPPEYTEKVSCTFGEAMYMEVLSKRYGIEDCCDINVTKWTIKKELLNLKVLEDPNFITPPTKVCYCYTIQQIAETVTYKYIDCEGCLTSITILPGSTEYVCSQSYPKPFCPPVGAVYNIVNSEEICTTNADCQASCQCINVSGGSKYPNIFEYQDCATQSIKTVTLAFQETINICAVENTFVVIANNPVAAISGSCTSEGGCFTCACYTVTALGKGASYSYTGCDGTIYVDVLLGRETNICARVNTVTGNLVDIQTSGKSCTQDLDCQPCNCYTIDPMLAADSVYVKYIDCETGNQISTGLLTKSITFCAVEGTVSWTSDPTVEVGPACETDADCQSLPCGCARVLVQNGSVTINYSDCSGSLISENLNPGVYRICSSTEIQVSGPGTADIQYESSAFNCAQGTCNYDNATCYSFIVNGTSPITYFYYDAGSGLLNSSTAFPGQITTVCSRIQPYSNQQTLVTYNTGNLCNSISICPSQGGCLCYQVTYSEPGGPSSIVFSTTNCNTGDAEVTTLTFGNTAYICALNFPQFYLGNAEYVTIIYGGPCNGTSICNQV